jgi:hypothetical protein
MRILFILILIVPLVSSSQTFEKGTNVIKIKGVSFQEVLQHLVDVGYSFKKVDSNYHYVITEFKDVNKYTFTIQYDVRWKDSIATVKGKVENGGMVFDVGYYKPQSIIKRGFLMMNNFATWFNKPIEYLKE